MKNLCEQSTPLVDEASEALTAALEALTIPKGYVFKSLQIEVQNSKDTWVFRYEKTSFENNGFGGEHFSFVLDKVNRRILGFRIK